MHLKKTVHEKNACSGMKWGQEVVFPANPDLADVLGDMDLILRTFIFDIFWIETFWSSFPDFQNLVRAGPEPSGPKNVDVLL